jgi:8-oxo-dGTP pyrophosphatase MutT (NUDIX family)
MSVEEQENKIVQVATGVVLNKNGQVLVGKRASHKPLAGFWEFPGGKIEAGETEIEAFIRELGEEAGIKKSDLFILGTPGKVISEVSGHTFALNIVKALFVGKHFYQHPPDHEILTFMDKDAVAGLELIPSNFNILKFI